MNRHPGTTLAPIIFGNFFPNLPIVASFRAFLVLIPVPDGFVPSISCCKDASAGFVPSISVGGIVAAGFVSRALVLGSSAWMGSFRVFSRRTIAGTGFVRPISRSADQ